jgi:hypothetical protein
MNRLRVLFPFFVLGIIVGCTQKHSDGMPRLYKTEITIIQDGKPLEGTLVSLMPSSVQDNWAAGGNTNTKGSASLFVHGKYEGTVPGKYKIIITKMEDEPVPTDKMTERGCPVAGYTQKRYNLINSKFSGTKTSQEVEVILKPV